ncbi:MAG: FAD-linked oxidase C-terminal domain-containing protein [Halieaceae bacterium]|jgi:glycolate oxidase|nr:FAD-linked oxidase C-terminal domain-containing protein [Halieaceae bacterium]
MNTYIDPAPDAVDRAALQAALASVLPAQAILAEAEQQRPYECDGLPTARALPLLTVLPETVAQVQAVLRCCSELGVPVVTRGAGTGLSCGATPLESGVLLVTSRMDALLSVDPQRRTARVQPGMRNLAISEAVAPYGLYYAPDPSSQIACSIGGNVAENAGGVHCLKYGLTVNNIEALTVVTMDGELLELHVDDEGPDLLAAFIGSEGLFGVAVEITVKLLPVPATVETLLVGFDSVADCASAVSAIIAEGVIPAGMEMMDRLALTAAEAFAGAGYPQEAAAILLIELDGEAALVAAELAVVEATLERCGATSLRRAQDAAERALLWKGRKSAFPAVARLRPDYYCMDGTIPRSEIGAVLGYIAERADHYGLSVANVFHAGDGNLHPLILFDANAGELDKAERLGADILERCVAAGGTITGEHGVGLEKINQMAVQFSDAELAQFRRLKQAFDPRGLLNPGKTIPTLRRCQEYRAILADRAA